jgi:hypothetical protein
MNRWWCMDCRSAVELDKHGRCGCCESEAVDLMEPKYGLTGSFSVVQTEAMSAPAYS